MPLRVGCPTPHAMKQLLLGLLPEDQLAALESHLDDCARCQQVLDRLQVDSLLTRVLKERSAGSDNQSMTVRPEIREMVDRLEQLGTHWSLLSGGLAVNLAEDEAAGPFLEPAQAPDELGRMAHYRVLQLLGAGGMGLVYRAEDTRLRRPVALKVLRPRYARRAEARERFLREARAMAAVKHDHIATIFEVGEAEGDRAEAVPFLAMELLEGESLADWLRTHCRPPAAWVARLGRQTAAGLAAAHARGLIHRDVKPANLWLEAPPGWASESPSARPALAAVGRIKLLDFGLAAPLEEGENPTAPEREVMGTPAYMAPEQVRGEPLDARCDLFALGCVLYELCTGELPFRRDRRQLRERALADGTPPPVNEVNPGVPPALAELVGRLLAPAPASRPASARAVEQQLAAIERETGTADTDPSCRAPTDTLEAGRSVAPVRPRRQWLPWAVAGGVALLCVALALYWGRRPSPTEVLPAGPPDDAWCQFVSRLPLERQGPAVGAKLRELNPDFDGRVSTQADEKAVIEFEIPTDAVTDIRPLRALTSLRKLGCVGTQAGRGSLTDLSPLRGMNLDELRVWYNPSLTDFSPLRGMTLVYLDANGTGLRDLNDLDGSRLEMLHIPGTPVRDLGPIRRMPKLRSLSIMTCPIESLEPLSEAAIDRLYLTYRPERDERILRRMPNLRMLNFMPIKDFWQMQGREGR